MQYNLKEAFYSMLLSFMGAFERFFDNRFNGTRESSEVIFLRNELNKVRMDYNELVKSITSPKVITQEPDIDTTNLKPIGSRPHWRVQANQMAEQARVAKAQKEEQERLARVTSNTSRPVTEDATIEALESELGIVSEVK